MSQDTLADAEQRMGKALDALHRDLNTVRTGRASPSLLDRVTVDYYGAETPLNQLAGISVPESRLLVIQPWDRGSIGAIERAIQKSELGLNPNNDGTVIRLAIPPLTEERRKQLVKQVHAYTEESKVAVRNIRRDAIEHIRKQLNAKEISEDDERRATHQADELTKRFVDEADAISKAKEQEVMEV
ncbi:MAG TPA: ribosome recycling factor [Thermomicrobiales bacterium]|jgi:ribosome recycling factor|nr:ribosome recycling factor [Thermomicrobiales bacterium]